jgi:signal peptidase I
MVADAAGAANPPNKHARSRRLRLQAALAILVCALLWMANARGTAQQVFDHMAPTIRNGDHWLAIPAYRNHPPAVGDVVSFRFARYPQAARVVGSPGDRLALRGGEVVRLSPGDNAPDAVTVTESRVALLGDNRTHDDGSLPRGFYTEGPARGILLLPASQITGKVIATWRFPSRLRLVAWHGCGGATMSA